MTARTLLVRGMLVGVAAGIVAFLFALAFGEGPVDQAIAFEAAHATEPGGDEAVSRGVQATLGLATGTILYAVALGGIFALVFALAYGRFGRLGARATAGLVALGGFVTVSLVPALKYPANPPATGNPDTLDQRTVLFWLMIVISVAAGLLAVQLGRHLAPRWGTWNAAIAAALGYVLVIAAVSLPLPSISEVPEGFPAILLWNFRLASLGTQLAVWATLGLLFGALTQRAVDKAASGRRDLVDA
jgi:predicted cobalt transporter CbtA